MKPAAILPLLLLALPAHADTLAKTRAAGHLTCGVVTEETDYTKADTHGGLDDLGAELCKAVATAALGGSARAVVTGSPDERTALQELAAGHTDLLIGVTPTATKASLYGVRFAPPVFLDGQGFLVNRNGPIHALADLSGKLVCFIGNTEAEAALGPGLAAHGIAPARYPFEEMGEMDASLVSGHCAAETGDISQLAEQRAAFHARKADFDILPETIGLDPLSPAMRADDPRWADIVTWAIAALIQAEASGVTKDNAAAMRASDDPAVRRLLGVDWSSAQALDLPRDWAATMIEAFGNYGDIYARTIGPGTEMNLPRGRNALWTQGGLLYPWPVR